jgi:hypothetical protein
MGHCRLYTLERKELHPAATDVYNFYYALTTKRQQAKKFKNISIICFYMLRLYHCIANKVGGVTLVATKVFGTVLVATKVRGVTIVANNV